MFRKYIYSYIIIALLLSAVSAVAQSTLVKGVVTDSKSKERLPYVSITVTGTTIGTSTNMDGQYSLVLKSPSVSLKFTYVGYKTITKTIKPGEPVTLNVQLVEESKMLSEVVVKPGRKASYKNKNNPAVELIQKVIQNKDKNSVEGYDYAQYEQYEKLSLSLSHLSEKFMNKKIFRNYQFLFKHQDSSMIAGDHIMPLYLEEKLADNYFRKDPRKTKEIIKGKKTVNFDKNFIDQDGISGYMNKMYQDIDIYQNNISVISNQFLSPISNNAPSFYKYFIDDTVTVNNTKLVGLYFAPRGKADMLFQGKLYITLDGNYAVQKVFLTVNPNINLNFVRTFQINLEFAQNPDGRYHMSKSTSGVDFALTKNNGKGFYGERTVSIKDFSVNQPPPDSVFQEKKKVIALAPPVNDDQFWQQNRHMDLSSSEASIYTDIDSLQTIKSFKRTMNLVTFLLAGYKSFGPFEIGPANTFYSFNDVEGFRGRLGGRTTPEFSKRIYFETYGAYGFKDEKAKYFLSSTYSLNNKSIYSFPLNYIMASFQHDTKIPGQELQFVQEDNFLLSFKRGDNTRILYNDIFRIDYLREFENHFSYQFGLKVWQHSPAGGLTYQRTAENGPLLENKIKTSELSLQLRWAPGEKFYQSKSYRSPIPGPNPEFRLNYSAGIKGLIGGEYNYQNLSGSVSKRFYLSQLGYTTISLDGGYIFGQLPLPLLYIHRANQTYAYQINSYNLMNFMEFASDHYASVNVDYSFNGFFFNKIPLIKRLKLREAFSFKGVYGGIRDENDPDLHPEMIQFPRNTDGQQTSFSLNKEPYMEGSVGVSNIFKILRVDLVKRFNYLDNPDVSDLGIRARFKFDF